MADTEDSRAKRLAANTRAYRAANLEKVRTRNREGMRAWARANREEACERVRTWAAAHPVMIAYQRQKSAARRRGIQFLLSFEEWRTLWLESGKWEQRGKRKGQYVMARYGDAGAYAVDNVRICTNRENSLEAWETSGDETRRRMSKAAKARWARARHDTSRL